MREIADFKNQLIVAGTRGLVLDIDECLSKTAWMWFQQMVEKFGNPENLSVDQLIKKYKLVQNAPYWASNPKAMDWIYAQRYSEEAHANAPLIENSQHYVNKINLIVPIVGYLTSRFERLRPVTTSWLKKHDFPDKPLLMKPADKHVTDTSEWKAQVLHELYPEVLGIVDDNPDLISHLPKDYRGTIYLYDQENKPATDSDVVLCPTWENVYQEVLTRGT